MSLPHLLMAHRLYIFRAIACALNFWRFERVIYWSCNHHTIIFHVFASLRDVANHFSVGHLSFRYSISSTVNFWAFYWNVPEKKSPLLWHKSIIFKSFNLHYIIYYKPGCYNHQLTQSTIFRCTHSVNQHKIPHSYGFG